ncbi:MAG TPA: non-canonical purine NTP pyrophosphatase [Chloroflexota bacterium]|nr:non-canonical purine NTP pyrophosphatase [Chloroflexota bacterium]
MNRLRLLLATNNVGKIAEYRELLRRVPLDLVTLGDLGKVLEPAEDGTTYRENAILKAGAFAAERPDLMVLADDSGLELAVFDGWPGIHSVRFAGPGANDATRRRLILGRLGYRPAPLRQARFVCAVAVAQGRQILIEGSGQLDGSIALAESGSGGFGYDPIFISSGHVHTLGELGQREKNRISHRALAVAQIRAFLAQAASAGGT